MALQCDYVVHVQRRPGEDTPSAVIRDLYPGVPEAIVCEDITIPNAYVRIVEIKANKATGKALILVAVQHDESSTGSMVDFSEQMEFDASLESPNLWGQAYAHLKELPELSGAVDC